jgi:hypothetical protein
LDIAGYKFIEKSPPLFEFYTNFGAAYSVVFTPADDYLPTGYSQQISLFSIDIKFLYPGPYNQYDFIVSIGVAEIVLYFFAVDERRIIFYICDPSDGKMKARKRKFDYWFDLLPPKF